MAIRELIEENKTLFFSAFNSTQKIPVFTVIPVYYMLLFKQRDSDYLFWGIQKLSSCLYGG